MVGGRWRSWVGDAGRACGGSAIDRSRTARARGRSPLRESGHLDANSQVTDLAAGRLRLGLHAWAPDGQSPFVRAMSPKIREWARWLRNIGLADATEPGGRILGRWLAVMAAVVFVGAWWETAWIADDAYLTFRTIEVWFAGHGPNFNPGQRVFGTTSPLWFFVLCAGRLLYDDIYWVALAISGICMAVTLYVGWRWLREPRTFAIFVLLFAGSRALTDYASSGLETPLSCALLTAFVWRYSKLFDDGPSPRNFVILAGLAAAVLFTRHDLVVFVGPACFWVLIHFRDAVSRGRWAALVVMVLAPLGLWMVFSLVYYGSAFPPAGIAKLSFSKYGDRIEVLKQGWETLWVIAFDPISMLILVVGLGACVRYKRHFAPLAAGGLLYLSVFVYHGGDWMDARIYVPLLVVLAPLVASIIADKTSNQLLMYHIAVGAALAMLWPAYGWTSGRARGFVVNQRSLLHGFNEYYRGRTSGKEFTVQCPDWTKFDESHVTRPSGRPPMVAVQTPEHHPAFLAQQIGCGEFFRKSDFPLAGVHIAVLGLFGYYAGPDKYVLEELLLDPLLARLPPSKNGHYFHHMGGMFRPGHSYHDLPAGYVASIFSGKNEIEDPKIAALYDDIILATKAPLNAPGRLAALWRLNTGHDYGTDAPWEAVWGPL